MSLYVAAHGAAGLTWTGRASLREILGREAADLLLRPSVCPSVSAVSRTANGGHHYVGEGPEAALSPGVPVNCVGTPWVTAGTGTALAFLLL